MAQVTHKFNATCMSSVSHMCVLSGHTCVFVYMRAHTCSLIIYTCELYMPCPHMVIHTCVYYYKMVAYGLLHSELKILAKLQLGVICIHDQMVDFCKPGHIIM